MKKTKLKATALMLSAAVIFSMFNFSSVCAVSIGGSEQVNLVAHTNWDFKLYNDFNKYPVGYKFVKGTDYATDEDMELQPVAANGYKSTAAVTTKIISNKNQSYTLIPAADKGFRSDFTGAKEFWAWVDFSNVLFRKMFFGFTGTDGNVYQTDDMDDRSNMTYYIEDGSGGWKEMKFDTDGCMEFGNYKGFVRFSTDYFVCGKVPLDLSKISGLKVWYDLPGDGTQGTGVSFTVDQVGFAGPSLTGADSKVGDFAGNGSLVLPSQLPKQTFDENNIKVRFGVMSDIHIQGASGETCDKFASALQQLKAKSGDKLDAVLAAGDLTDSGTPGQAQSLASILKNNLDLSKTRFIFSLGNHEYYSDDTGGKKLGGFLYKNAIGDAAYTGATNDEIQRANYHTTVNGYDYIAINCAQYDGGVKYAQQDIDWLKDQLAKAAAAHPGQPIFVISHPMITNTNWGSNYGDFWAGSDLYEIFKQYPQVVYFAGHLHFPLNDERSIWQGDFTTIGTGSVYYESLEDKYNGLSYTDMSGSEPTDCKSFSQGLYLEVDANNNTRVTRMDFFNKGEIKSAWILPAPKADKSNLKYYTDMRSLENRSPAFDSADTVSILSRDEKAKTITVEFNQAKDDDMTFSYMLTFTDVKTGRTKNIMTYSDFYRHPQTSGMGVKLQKTLSAGTMAPFSYDYPNDFYITVRALDSYGAVSDPIKSEVYKGTPPDPTKPQEPVGETVYPNWDFKLFNDFNSFKEGYQPKVSDDYNSWPVPGASNANDPIPVSKNGYKDSTAITMKINTTDSYFIVYFPDKAKGYKTDFTGAKEFWAWVDFSQVKFSKFYFGFRTDNAYGTDFDTATSLNDSSMKAYIQDGNGGWKALPFDSQGYLNDFGNYKGFIRFSVDYFRNGSDSLYPENIGAFKLWMTPASADYIGKTITFDQVGFAGPTLTDNDGKVKDQVDTGSSSQPSSSSTPSSSSSASSSSSTTPSSSSTAPSSSSTAPSSSSTAPPSSSSDSASSSQPASSSETSSAPSDSSSDVPGQSSSSSNTNSNNPKTGGALPLSAGFLLMISLPCAAFAVYKSRKK